MSAEEVAKAFVQHFYQTMDAGVDALSGLYVSYLFIHFLLPTIQNGALIDSNATSILLNWLRYVFKWRG